MKRKLYVTPRACYRKAPVKVLTREEREEISDLARRDFLKAWQEGTGRKRVKRVAARA